MHARYGCRHSGRCCSSGWPIPVEPDRLSALEGALASGVLQPARLATPPVLRPASAPADAPAVLGVSGGHCVFHAGDRSGGCAIHATLGHAALPLACRQFPRVVVTDPRGHSVTLSHYCPTAALLLEAPEPLAIVTDAPGLPDEAEYVGLDVRSHLPPLLRPDMLMDWEAWWEWERRSVVAIEQATTRAEALRRLSGAVERVRRWSPADGPLVRAVERAFGDAAADSADESPPLATTARQAIADITAATPPAFRSAVALPASAGPTPDRIRRRLLAAHAFGSWAAHLGQGLRTWLRGLAQVDALAAAGLSPSDVDLRLRHLADPRRLAERWSEAERSA